MRVILDQFRWSRILYELPNEQLKKINAWKLEQYHNMLEKNMEFDTNYTQYVLISKGPISKTGQISGFFKQWLMKFSKLSKNLFCSRFLSNPLVNVFNLSKSKLLLLHSNYHRFSCLDMLKLLCHSLDSAWLYNSQEFERNRFIFVFWANFD